MQEVHLNPAVKHDIVLLYDVTNGNPNGDPDAGNRPRTDEETNQGIVTDVSLKRRIRDTIGLAAQDLGLPAERYQLFIEAGEVLDNKVDQALVGTGVKIAGEEKAGGKLLDRETIAAAHRALYERYVDIRLFGAVLTSGKGALGHLRGPLQVGFSRSIDPVLPVDHAITRVVASSEKRSEENVRTEMGGKWTIPYALYRVSMHYSAQLGEKAGVTGDDLRALYHTIPHMFEHTRSAARPDIGVQGLYVFSHAGAFGNARVHELESRITVQSRDSEQVPRRFQDYKVEVDDGSLPEGVTLTRLIG